MSILYFIEDVPFPKFKKRRTSTWIKSVIISEGKSLGDISFIFCSDDYILEVNKKYLNHEYFTDIITFDYVVGDLISGDIFISIDRVKDNSNKYSETFEDEFHRILIHGILHLLGFKDKIKKDKKIMTEKENYYLKYLVDN